MRNLALRAGRAAAAGVSACVLAGCGTASGKTAPADAGPKTVLTQKAVLADVKAAIASAGLSRQEITAGFPDPKPGRGASAEQGRKVESLTRELSPCHVSWVAERTGDDPAAGQRDFEAVLEAIEARGWTEPRPAEDMPLGSHGTVLRSTYHKQGWSIHAQHAENSGWIQSSAVATRNSCFDGLTEEEQALLERLDD
ncbi:hypothetical protein [Streptomyces sp. NPDC005930]|uniref:hypothetical protein n=1 Tax=Streptomyces sp. NPDC005930 TaxID=3364736 RepID=UPI003677742C